MNLSVIISTYNNQDQILDCLKSIHSIADEIIIVDNHSTDQTVALSQKFTSHIFSRQNNPLALNLAKNYGFTKAKGDWLLSLDPDERITPALAKEILTAKNYAAYQMPRKNIIFGRWIKHGLWYPDYQIRLFRKNKGKFPGIHNHEKLSVQGEIGTFKHHLTHYNYTSVTQYLDKINHLYSDNEAKNLLDSGKKVSWYDAIRMPLSDFIANFFAREAYKDGLHGLVLILLQAFYTFVVFAKIWEMQQFETYQNQNFLKEVIAEFSSKAKEFKYWYQLKNNSFTAKIRRLWHPKNWH